MGRVQRAVRAVLYDAAMRGEVALSTREITERTFRNLASVSEEGTSWTGSFPREHHYGAVRRALRTLGEHDPDLKLGVEEEV
jgi:hypothetical protein